MSRRDAEQLYDAIEAAVWSGASWEEVLKQTSECYEVAMRRHADGEIAKAKKAVLR